MKRATQREKPAWIAEALRPVVKWGWIGAVAVGVLIAVFAAAKGQPKAQLAARDDAAVLAADATLGEAMRGGNKAAARRLLALQFSFVDADGKIHARKDFLTDLKGVAAAAASDAKVRRYGLLATVTGHRKAAHDGDVFFLDVWAKQKGAWRALLIQDVATATAQAPAPAAATPTSAGASHYQCTNPCQAIPYRVRSTAEQDIINAFQAIMKITVARDAAEWGRHVADDFMGYASGQAPIAKSGRIDAIERERNADETVTVGEVQTLRLSVYGDGALMTATDVERNGLRYRAARVFLRRNGQWLMAFSAHTDVK